MTQSYKQPGSILTVTAPYARTASGLGMKVGALFGVTCDAIANAVAGQVQTEGVHSLLKIGSQAWAVGDRIFWDDTNKRLTSVATDGMFVGVCTTAVGAGAGETTGEIKLAGLQLLAEGAQTVIAAVATADSDATYGAAESTLLNEIKAQLNLVIAALKIAGIVASS